jgi:hypothetical protein
MATRRELIGAIGQRYRSSSADERRRILDEFVRLTGYHRKHAIRVLGPRDDRGRSRAARPRLYDQAVQEVVKLLWEAADRVCGKRLKAILPTLIEAMRRHGHLDLEPTLAAKLATISAATIDRMLAGARQAGLEGRRRRNGVGSAIRKSVPIRTFADWHDPEIGFLEVDMVEHCGGSKQDGNFVHSLVLTDIHSGWTECVALLIREQHHVVAGLQQARVLLPFPLLGIDTDNDSAFMTQPVADFCEEAAALWTRSRAYKKNDQAWVEQKNGSVVRRLVGYGRLSGPRAQLILARLYTVSRLYVNFFQPCFKLKAKHRDGARVKKTYHPPQTPYERVMANNSVTPSSKQRLREEYLNLDPVELLSQIRALQQALATLAESGTATTIGTTDVTSFLASLPTLWKNGEVRPTHRIKAREARWWRTRHDPFEATWPLVRQWLEAEPHATGKDLLRRIQAELPEQQMTMAHLRTLQRRIKAWRNDRASRVVASVMAFHSTGAAAPVE